MIPRTLTLSLLCVLIGCGSEQQAADKHYDVVIRNGTIYDGSGGEPYTGDVGIEDGRIVGLGDLGNGYGEHEVDATGLAVAPGFINMLSWAVESLIEDGRAMSDIKQGVTLEVFGEGFSMGPLNDTLRKDFKARQGDIQYDLTWTTLGEYLDFLETKGVSPNVASYVGATTLRVHEVGYENRDATTEELARMQDLVRQAMEQGALGVGSSLIYAPANFANTDELIALAKAASDYGGAYISHIRSEGDRLEQGIEELITIARSAGVPAEIYHLKASGKPNWHKLERVFQMIEQAREEGLRVTADMYTYPASATGLNAAMPLWVQEGGHDAWMARLRDPELRARVAREMVDPDVPWENRYVQAGPDNILLLGFKTEKLRPLIGKTVKEVADMRNSEPVETVIDLVLEDNSRVDVSYFMMSEDNVRKKVARSWVSFGSDAAAPANEGVFLQSNPHPRAYGTFARVLGRYSRDEDLMPLQEAIRRMTSLPAENIGIRHRGALKTGYFADVVVFDSETITDHATFPEPHQYATGMIHVWVNGEHVLRDGEHTGAMPGRVVRGPGWTGWSEDN